MKKIEIIWREILYQAIEKKNRRFVQQDLAQKFGFSTSTVFQALKPLRKMGAVDVGGRNFIVLDPEKVLYYWASVRNLKKDLVLSWRTDLPIYEREGRIPPAASFACYSAARQILEEAPADYDKVYFYFDLKTSGKKPMLEERLPAVKGQPNVFILQADPFLSDYGQLTTLAQTFVDLWNLEDWYAKDFVKDLKRRIDGLLS